MTNNQGNSSSVKVIITVEDTLGINNPEDLKIDIALYPDLTTSLIHIKTNAIIKNYRLMDINSKVIFI